MGDDHGREITKFIYCKYPDVPFDESHAEAPSTNQTVSAVSSGLDIEASDFLWSGCVGIRNHFSAYVQQLNTEPPLKESTEM
jgi:hypothetical protein